MPELPDVEGFRRVAQQAAGQKVQGVQTIDTSVLRNTSRRRFESAIVGNRLSAPSRSGKWLLLPVDGATMVVHFGMTGLLEWRNDGDARHPHDRVALDFDGRRLVYRDQRKLQGVWLAQQAGELDDILGPQGPDALGLSRRQLSERLEGRRRPLKDALMDQSVIAGVGNYLADEVLWQARIAPGRRWYDLKSEEQDGLHEALRRVLRTSVRAGRVPATRGWLTSQRDAVDPACPRCGRDLERTRIGGRSTWWCPACQPSSPADRRGGGRRGGGRRGGGRRGGGRRASPGSRQRASTASPQSPP